MRPVTRTLGATLIPAVGVRVTTAPTTAAVAQLGLEDEHGWRA